MTGTNDVQTMADPASPTSTFAQRATGTRELDIDRAKGFAIALVVWAHVPSAGLPVGPLWYYITISVIYAFHMPLFMYLSGYVFFLIGGPDRFWNAPGKQIVSRFDRLLVPFLFFAVLVVLGKYLAGIVGAIADPVTSISDGLIRIFKNTPDNPSISIWYLFVLFIYTIFTPFLWRVTKKNIFILILLGFFGWITNLPEEFYLNRIATYFVFFAIGGAVALHRDAVLPLFRRFAPISLGVFCAICFVMLDNPYRLLVCGLASIPAIHGIFTLKMWKNDRFMLTLGQNSMAIYLMNTIFIGFFAILMIRFVGISRDHFIPAAVLLTLLGIGGPMVVRGCLGQLPMIKRVKRYLD